MVEIEKKKKKKRKKERKKIFIRRFRDFGL